MIRQAERADPERSPYFLHSLAKGLGFLQAMAGAGRPLRLSDLAQATGSNHATTTRMLFTLTALGFVRRDPERRYHLAPKVLSLGYAAVSALGWRQVAMHYLEALAAELKETVNLSVMEGDEIVYVGRLTTDRILPYDLQLGSRLPVYCTSMGKALLAFSPPDAVASLLARIALLPLTHHTITDPARLAAELDLVRRQGYAVNDEELSVGLRSAAAPILDRSGRAMAAINVAVPTKRVGRERLEGALAPRLMSTAQEIERAVLAMPD